MKSCLFCDIAAGRTAADIIHADDRYVAFRDVAPKAPTHVLVVPRQHVEGLNDLVGPDADALTEGLLAAGVQVAHSEGLAPGGYRFVINCGEDGGQSVAHLHLHILGGRTLTWPPG